MATTCYALATIATSCLVTAVRTCLKGQGGDDFVSGDYGNDDVNGNEGSDTVVGGRGADDINGQEGDDVLFGGIIEGLPLNLEEMEALRNGESLADLNNGIDLRDDQRGNTLRGGDGDDDLIVGSGDDAAGGTGADTFHLLSEQENNNAGEAVIRALSGNDALTIIVEDTDDDTEVTVEQDGDDAIVSYGDNVLARVVGAGETLEASDITLIAESTAAQLFDPNAPVA